MDLKALLEHQKEELEIFYNLIDLSKIEELVNIIYLTSQNGGNIIFCGVGKSGNIGTHIASLLNSIGIPSLTIDPTDALHGDIGFARKKDLIIFLSKSGNTDELSRLGVFLSKKKIPTIGIFCNNEPKLKKFCNKIIPLPKIKELDAGFNMVPTTSVLVFIFIGNIITSSLIKLQGLTLSGYSENHPSGSIGRKILLSVEDVMEKNKLVSIKPDKTISDCMFKLCGAHSNTCLVLDSQSKLLGLVTDSDLRRVLLEDNGLTSSEKMVLQVSEIMTKNPITINKNEKLYDVYKKFETVDVVILPVINDQNIVEGVISTRDLLGLF